MSAARRPWAAARPGHAVVMVLALVAMYVGAQVAAASEERWTLDEISRELMCPQCEMRLDLSTGGAAERVRVFIERRRVDGWTKREVKDALVAEYGQRVLASPPRSGFGGLAWLVPAGVVLAGAAVTVLGLLAVRRRPARARPAPVAASPGGDAELDRRLDDALRRFDP